MTPEVNIDQRVAILFDGNNIEKAVHQMDGNTSTMVSFDILIPRLVNGRKLTRFVYFREGASISAKLQARLHHKFYGIARPCHKSADIPLTIEAVQLAEKIDTIIIASGDADYIELVRFLKSRGVRVEIVAVHGTAANALLREVDRFTFIDRNDLFTYTPQNFQIVTQEPNGNVLQPGEEVNYNV